MGCGEEGSYICMSCTQKSESANLICPYCRHASFGGATHSFCAKEHGLDGLYVQFRYTSAVRAAILALKYRFAYEIARELSDIFIEALGNQKLPDNSIIVPIPLHARRERWRGFNQSYELSRMIFEDKIVENNLLVRKKHTETQARLSREERLQNIRGKFAVNQQILSQYLDKKVILFDDVFTTGSTMFEACNVIKKSGINNVWGVAVAR